MSSEQQFSEEQLRALEAELDRVTVDEVLVQTMVSLLNLGARKAGLADPSRSGAPKPDWAQTRQAIEAVRVLIPLVEQRHPEQANALRDMLSQLQMAYARMGPGAGAEQPQEAPAEPAAAAPQPEPPAQPEPGEAGPAQRSGRLWVPGQ